LALLTVSLSGCLFSGMPCASGNWHYHSCGCRRAANCRECQTCATPSELEGLNDTEGRPDQPEMQPTPEKIPPLPPSNGVTGPSRSYRAIPAQAAQLQWKEPRRPQSPIGAHSPPRTAPKVGGGDVQKASWQQPDDVLTRSTPVADKAEPAPRLTTTAGDHSGTARTINSASHAPLASADPSAIKSPPAPFAWGYFGATGR
jgi:hypothetical protein